MSRTLRNRSLRLRSHPVRLLRLPRLTRSQPFRRLRFIPRSRLSSPAFRPTGLMIRRSRKSLPGEVEGSTAVEHGEEAQEEELHGDHEEVPRGYQPGQQEE